jgi:hypothetical protein
MKIKQNQTEPKTSAGGSGNGHYGGNSEVYMDVGEAMGKAMVELMKK